jgi:hypothetical protein
MTTTRKVQRHVLQATRHWQQKAGVEYLRRLPKAVPAGSVLVHNHVRPTRHLNMRGFRAWLSQPDLDAFEVCACGWASKLGPHFRVRVIKKGGA